MSTVREIFAKLCEIAPLGLQCSFDNAGFLVGRGEAPARRALLALDITGPVIDEAVERQAELIVTHHPVIFNPLRSVTEDDPVAALVLRLIENRIAVISMHTNLDIAEGGVNDVLMRLLGGSIEGPLDEEGCGRIGRLERPMPMADFLPFCKERLQTKGLRYVDAGKPVYRLAVMGGAGAGSLERAAALGCDTYVTADIKYHEFLTARELGLNLIDGDHFCTENPVMATLRDKLAPAFPDTEFLLSQVHGQTISFF